MIESTPTAVWRGFFFDYDQSELKQKNDIRRNTVVVVQTGWRASSCLDVCHGALIHCKPWSLPAIISYHSFLLLFVMQLLEEWVERSVTAAMVGDSQLLEDITKNGHG